MRFNLCRTLPILVLSGLLTAIQPAFAATATTAPAQKPPATYPQIVRLSYVEGDVRVSRGKQADKAHEGEPGDATGWEQAVTDLPIESGYSLVTGKGRAEIEFEDASTVYLGDNSVLSFTELSTTDSVPYTEIQLLSGTATLNVKPMVWREWFHLYTPTDNISITYPQNAYVRVNSYLDAVSITPLQSLTFRLPGLSTPRPQVAGQTMSFNHGYRLASASTMDPATAKDWDTWVAARVEARNQAMIAAMKDAGLTAPIPGLDQMNGKGKFFACEPYGTCWEPTNGWEAHATDVALVKTEPVTASATQAPPQPSAPQGDPVAAGMAYAGKVKPVRQSAADAYLTAHPDAILRTEDYAFPCSVDAYRELIATDPVTGRETIVDTVFSPFGGPYVGGFAYPGAYPLLAAYGRRNLSPFWGFDAFNSLYPWDWAVCHAGTWVRWQHHYAWVAGSKRHHHHPVRWVKTGHGLGFVPIHPRDVAGKPPINLKDGIFRVTGKKEAPIERLTFKEGDALKILDETPKEFRSPNIEPLRIAEVPHPTARSAFNTNEARSGFNAPKGSTPSKGTVTAPSSVARSTVANGFAAKEQGTPITFDRKSQSFSVARQVITENGRPTMVTQTIGGGRTYEPSGNNGASRSYTPSNNGGSSNSGSASRSYTPSNNGGSSNSGSASRPSTPAPSYNGGGSSGVGSYSHPSAPAPSAPAPSFSGGGGGGGSAPSGGGSSGGASPHK